MSLGALDYSSVQWGRKMVANIEPFMALSAEQMQKIAQVLGDLARLKAEDVTPTTAQITVILQQLHTKNLDKLEASKGGLMVYLSGGGFEYERFLLKEDGRVPNYKYESKKAK